MQRRRERLQLLTAGTEVDRADVGSIHVTALGHGAVRRTLSARDQTGLRTGVAFQRVLRHNPDVDIERDADKGRGSPGMQERNNSLRLAYEQEWRFLVELCTFLIPTIQTSTMIVGERAADETLVEGEVETPRIPLLSLLEEGRVAAERLGASKARAGLRMAIQDMLETSRVLTPAQVRDLDGRLSSAGLPTLTAMRERVWQTLAKVIARGRCRTEAEYYLVVERLSDMGDETLSDDDRQTLGRIVGDFEERHKRQEPTKAARRVSIAPAWSPLFICALA